MYKQPQVAKDLQIREYWAFRDEISVHHRVLFKCDRVIIPMRLHPDMRIHWRRKGAKACYRQTHQTLFWPNMQGEMNYVGRCSA